MTVGYWNRNYLCYAQVRIEQVLPYGLLYLDFDELGCLLTRCWQERDAGDSTYDLLGRSCPEGHDTNDAILPRVQLHDLPERPVRWRDVVLLDDDDSADLDGDRRFATFDCT